MIRTVDTAVDTIVGQVQRCEQHDPVSVVVFFDLFCQSIDFSDFFRYLTGQKNRCFPMVKAFSLFCLCNDSVNQFRIVPVGVCIGKRFLDFPVRDEFFCFQ